MTDFTIPPPQKHRPLILNSGDTLTVNNGGKSEDVTVNAEATEQVNTGGSSFRTTVNDGGREVVNHGTIDFTTINGGGVILNGSTADHTRINFSVSTPFSQMDVKDHSVATNTIIEGGGFLNAQHGLTVDATSTLVNVAFVGPSGKGAGIGLDNPLSLQGTIKGFSVGDFLQFGGLGTSSIDVTSFEVTKKNELIITYNNDLQAIYHLQAMQPHTTFQLVQGTMGQLHFSELIVVKTVGVADVQHDLAGHLV